MKVNILNLSFNELKKSLLALKLEKFRITQLCNWIYKKHIFNFSHMTNLSKTMQQFLSKHFLIYIPPIFDVVKSEKDESYKFLLKAEDCQLIESILMLAPSRTTVCVSCMIGCPLMCKFCATGTEIGFIRKLNTSEIIGQILALEKHANEHKITQKITNVVFMGMGEPFLNLNAVSSAIENLINKNFFGISKSKITISTVGVGTGIADFINKFRVKLAVSLHFPNDELRTEFMPVTTAFSLSKLIQELKKIKLGKRDFITIEYLMLNGINDKIEHAKQLVSLLNSVKVKFNLIPYNPINRFDAKPSSEDTINKFAAYLRSKNFVITIRRSYGIDIQGGCGQFALKMQK